MTTSSNDNTVSRLTRLETKLDTLQESIPEFIERRRTETTELRQDITALRESIAKMNECLLGLVKEMKFASEIIKRDIVDLREDQRKLEEKTSRVQENLDRIQLKIIGWSSAASAVFVLVGPKILHVLGI